MEIVDVEVIVFWYRSRIVRDEEGHIHPGPEHDDFQTLVRILTDEGVEGYCFGGDREAIEGIVRPAILGENPLYRERIWRKLRRMQRLYDALTDRVLAAVDMALWDLAGRYFDRPIYQLLGGYRDRVKAYASTMCGDEIEGGLDSPEAYADFAEECLKRGYRGFKLHTWMPPVRGAPDPKRDVEACRAVRERVGDEMVLMLDPYHHYTREEALYIGRELERLGFYWLEEPMDEYDISSYVWLAERLTIPLVGPETAKGGLQTRAEWIVRGTADIIRGGVWNMGGITPLIKLAHLCEAHGLRLELHGADPGNLQVLGVMPIPGEFYERGLLHPLIDYEKPPPWLKERFDPMDREGWVHIPRKPGLGLEINWDYIAEYRAGG